MSLGLLSGLRYVVSHNLAWNNYLAASR